MEHSKFEKLVEQSFLELPEKIRKTMENVAIVVEEQPTAYQLRKTGIRYAGFLFGLYEGVPKTVWGRGFGGHLPDKITIFQKSIENFTSTPKEIKKLVKNVVWHEIAHHFGLDEKEVRKLEEKRK